MDKKTIAKEIIESSNGIAKTAELIVAGLSKTDISKLCNDEYIIRVRHGYYSLAETNDTSEEQLIQTLLPEAIVCVESALYYYGYSDFAPRVWTLAVPRTMTKTKINMDAIYYKPYYIQNKLHSLGKTYADFGGVILPIYDRERTICDCFKYRTKLDNEIFNKAVNSYVADDKKNLSNLSSYAKEMKVYKKVMELMEVLLNG
ncbi:MAG: type IV toxin-antitoxin system AbiEi family antitoxin domain-containing protein [Clostridiales bacterium]|nr:type IV toxin-antitoxin system AbiEi family antitoxin domain-containing protein [Clostridiales bacterium]